MDTVFGAKRPNLRLRTSQRYTIAPLADSARYGTGGPDRVSEVTALCSGKKRQAERVELRDPRHLAREWGEKPRLIEETGARGEGLIPWDLFDPGTVNWFVSRLTPKADRIPAEVICERCPIAEHQSTLMSDDSLCCSSAWPRPRVRKFDAM